MTVKMKVSDAAHVAWLVTFGHVHRDTIKLINRQKKIIDDLVANREEPYGEEFLEAMKAAETHVKGWDKE